MDGRCAHRRGLPVDHALWFKGRSRGLEERVRDWAAEVTARPDGPDGLIMIGVIKPLVDHLAAHRGAPGADVDIVGCANAFHADDVNLPYPVLMWNAAEGRLRGAPVHMSTPKLVPPRRAPAADEPTAQETGEEVGVSE